MAISHAYEANKAAAKRALEARAQKLQLQAYARLRVLFNKPAGPNLPRILLELEITEEELRRDKAVFNETFPL